MAVVAAVVEWRSAEPLLDPFATAAAVLDARLPALDGESQSISQWRGRVLVVNFWATWCAPCRAEIPVLNKLYDHYRGQGVQFIGIAVDDRDKVASYVRAMPIEYPLLVGGTDAMALARQAGDRKSVLPFTLVIDKTGKAAIFQMGAIRTDQLEDTLNPLL